MSDRRATCGSSRIVLDVTVLNSQSPNPQGCTRAWSLIVSLPALAHCATQCGGNFSPSQLGHGPVLETNRYRTTALRGVCWSLMVSIPALVYATNRRQRARRVWDHRGGGGARGDRQERRSAGRRRPAQPAAREVQRGVSCRSSGVHKMLTGFALGFTLKKVPLTIVVFTNSFGLLIFHSSLKKTRL